MTTQTSSALPPPSTPPPKYEVFLSFRGLDTRKGFTDYLYNTLMQKGIHIFRDDEQLDSGEPISTLLKAIEESQISVVILSKNYATSTWCLDELATMVELAANTKSRLILPVFYDVTPSEVREQTGEHFKEVFAQHDKDFKGEPGKVTRWKESLRYAREVITKIVERIFAELNNTNLTFLNDLKDFIVLPSNKRYLLPEDRIAWLEENLAGQVWDITCFVDSATLIRLSSARRTMIYRPFTLADSNLCKIDLFKDICSVDVELCCTEDSASLIQAIFQEREAELAQRSSSEDCASGSESDQSDMSATRSLLVPGSRERRSEKGPEPSGSAEKSRHAS
ncbi:hypothetical protein L3X38_038169 [Prunus dulcis]|uniref:ADP-ribosyl cyclase/cyclic ADP-ribose hydrolase n=1 Tax=Prunus dulcis TaxID=3755 RepID=A0AAD4V614_PRUDU|nr:hypothetical protein L3X38_038169 [Prunus dulcis]